MAHTTPDYSVADDLNIDAAPEYVIGDDEEDDNTNNIQAEKYRLMMAGHATHAYPSYADILNYSCNCYKAIPPVCIPASDKYILQGVLRI